MELFPVAAHLIESLTTITFVGEVYLYDLIFVNNLTAVYIVNVVSLFDSDSNRPQPDPVSLNEASKSKLGCCDIMGDVL